MKNNLYEVFSDNWINGGTVWLYSDPHFSDTEIYKSRHIINVLSKEEFDKAGVDFSYETYLTCVTNQADEMQVKRINSKLGKYDTIIFLGDIGDLEFIKKIKGYKVLILGNHDKGVSNYKRVVKMNIPAITACPHCGYSYEFEKTYNSRDYICSKCGEIFGTEREVYPSGQFDDNHLFDEVYEGPLMINDRVILSHEPIEQLPKYMFNIHGHDHANKYKSDNSLNICAEHINYTPVNLINLLKNGLLKDIENIHRCCIDKATKDKRKKELRKIDKKLKELYNK